MNRCWVNSWLISIELRSIAFFPTRYNKWQDEIKKLERKKDYLRGRSEDLLPIYEAHSRGDS